MGQAQAPLLLVSQFSLPWSSLLKLKSANPALTGRLFPSYRVSVLEFPAALTESTMSFQMPMVLGASGSLELGHSVRSPEEQPVVLRPMR